MSTAAFKPFEMQDADTVVGMMRDFYAIDNYPMDVAVSKGLYLEFIENDSLGKGWTISVDGEIAGYAILTFVFSFEYKGRIAFLDELYLSPATRGKGIGKQAVSFLTEQAKLHSVKIIYLEVEGHNTLAQKLYLSAGYELHNRGLMKLIV